MTAARRSPLAAVVAVLIVLLVGLLPSSAAADLPSTGSALGGVVHHHLALPGIVRAESVTAHLYSDVALDTAMVAALALLGWAARRCRGVPALAMASRAPGSRDPPRVR
ncbi:MAG: hypothetical protein ACJ74U_04140 [Jatrophihabitantaceae bacterium]